ncbi:MAG TPA: TlpA disulfide reductase family protein [Puia sp.]|nr:TlpA disulfide reductase family protein [Puia sp.]
MTKIYGLLFAVLISGTVLAQGSDFIITGRLNGFTGSDPIYLDEFSTSASGHIDSTVAVNGEFRFSGRIDEPAKQVMLRVGRTFDYKVFWLENSVIRVHSETAQMRDATVSGSKTQDDENQLDSAIKATGREMEQDTLFIQSHPASIISIAILSVYCTSWGKALTTRLYIDLSEENRRSSYGQKVLDYIRFNRNLKIGDRYADFEQPDVNGRMQSLSALHGKVVLLEFWGSWCTPCRQSNPELVKIYNEFKDQGFEILGVAADNHKEEWLKAIHDDGLPWINVTDLRGDQNKAVLMYGVSYFPASFLIDRSGKIVARDLRGDALSNKLRGLLSPVQR